MVLTTGTMPAILSNVPTRDRQLGGIAQLGERLNGIQEVSGSIPLISTKERHDESRVFLLVGALAAIKPPVKLGVEKIL